VKRKPHAVLPFPSFFYEGDCQAICLSWIGKVPASDIIETAWEAYRSILFSDAGLSFPAMKRHHGLNFEELFRSNRLLFTELLVAIERSRRSPTHQELSVSMDQAPFTYSHHPTRPKTRLKPDTVAAMMTEITGQKAEAGTLRKAANREGLKRKQTTAHWFCVLAEEAKHPLFTPASSEETVASVAFRAMLAGKMSDPKQQSDLGTLSLAKVRASIKRAKAVGEKFDLYMKPLMELAAKLDTSRTNNC
jgi:hypothetical protein